MWGEVRGNVGRVYGVGVEKCGGKCGKACWGVREGEGRWGSVGMGVAK